MLQCDANAKLGKEIINQDPHQISENGRILKGLMDREDLALLNKSNLCQGAITRHRIAKENNENSIIDYILVSQNLSDFLEQMFIDENRNFPLTKYATTKGIRKLVTSDHNILYAQFMLTYNSINWKKSRKEHFNLKNPECQEKFHEVTNNSKKLKNFLINGGNFEDQSKKFFSDLNDILHQCFRKIRVGKKSNSQEINALLAEKSKLKMSLQKNENEEINHEILIKINEIEKHLETLSSARNVKIIQEHIKLLGNSDNLNQNGMWKLKNKLWPKERDPPMAKFDEKGNLISSTEALKSLYLRTEGLKKVMQRIMKRKLHCGSSDSAHSDRQSPLIGGLRNCETQ